MDLSLTTQLGIALVCLASAFLLLAILSWHQSDKLKNLEKRVKKIEDDRSERKDSVLYTRPLRIIPESNYGTPVTRRELRKHRAVDGK